MTLEQLRSIHQARPFKAFTVRTADGNEYPVRHPEFLAISPSRRSIVVFTGDDAMEVIDLMMITSLHVGNGQKRKPRRRKSK